MPTAIDLARLPKMRTEQLRALYIEHFGRTPPVHRNLLIRELAWRTQEERNGGFDAQTRKLLQAAMRSATSVEGKRVSDDGPAAVINRAPKRRRKPSTSPALPVATRLVREWGGQRHEVTVVENGKAYRYRDRTYRSLTQLAREITGTHQSGLRFFGLTSRVGDRVGVSRAEKKQGGRS
jgi:hypothetical protein